MNKLLEIIRRKPIIFLIVSLGYLLIIGFIKWHVAPPVAALWYVAGGAIGVYLLDAAEVFIAITPSPFRNILFTFGYVVVSLFVITSSGNLLAQGLVLSLYLTLILWQIGQRQVTGSLADWYPPFFANWGLPVFIALFLLETLIFIAWA